MPVNGFAEAAKDVTLIIHEATMGDEEKISAFQKKHSTFSQALDVCQKSVFFLFRHTFLMLVSEPIPNTSC